MHLIHLQSTPALCKPDPPVQLHKLPGTQPKVFARLKQVASLFTNKLPSTEKAIYRKGFRCTEYTLKKKVLKHTH